MLTIISVNSLRRLTIFVLFLSLSNTSLLHSLKRSAAYEDLTAAALQQAEEPVTDALHLLSLEEPQTAEPLQLSRTDYKRLRTFLIYLQAYQLFLLPIVLQINFDMDEDYFVTSDSYKDNYLLFRLVENIVYVDRAFYHLDDACTQQRLAFFIACAYESIMIILPTLTSLTFSSPEEQSTFEQFHTAYNPPETYHTPTYNRYFPMVEATLDHLKTMLIILKNNLYAITQTHPYLLDYPSLPYDFEHEIAHAPRILEDKIAKPKIIFSFQQTRWYKTAIREKWLNLMLTDPCLPPFNIDNFVNDFYWVRFQLNTHGFLRTLVERLTKRHAHTCTQHFDDKAIDTLFQQQHHLCHQSVWLSFYEGDTRFKLIVDRVALERVPVY